MREKAVRRALIQGDITVRGREGKREGGREKREREEGERERGWGGGGGGGKDRGREGGRTRKWKEEEPPSERMSQWHVSLPAADPRKQFWRHCIVPVDYL